MRPTRSRVAPVVLLTAVALTGTADPAPAAITRRADTAAPKITSITVNPSPVILRTKNGGATTFAIVVKAADALGVDRVTVGLYDPSDSSGRAFRLKRTGGTAASGVWTGTLVLQNTARRGAWSVRAFATDLASNSSNPDTVYTNFKVMLPTRFHKLYVAADPATGKVVGQALLQNFRPGRAWGGFSGRPITLEFMPDGANSYLKVATAKTGADGWVHFDGVAANQSGTWRMTYAGNTGYAPANSVNQVLKVNVPQADPGTTTPAPSPTPAA
jgi:hypothetical protein